MIYVLYVALMIALPAAVGAQIVSKNINRKDPTAGFMLLLLAIVPAFGYAVFAPQGILAPMPFMYAGPAAFVGGAVIGSVVGIAQRFGKIRAA